MLSGALCCVIHQLFSLECEGLVSYFLGKTSWQCIHELHIQGAAWN